MSKVYDVVLGNGCFRKKDGSHRKMTFVLMKDMPEEFLTERVKGGKEVKPMAGGMERVWEVGVGFRTFNFGDVVGDTVYSREEGVDLDDYGVQYGLDWAEYINE